jgi:hypothetical protein
MLLKEEFEDTKGVNRSCKSKMNSQNNGQKKKEKKTNTTTKDRATRTQLTSGSELRCFQYLIFCFTDTNYSNQVYMLYLQIITAILKDILIMRCAFEKSVHGCTSYVNRSGILCY